MAFLSPSPMELVVILVIALLVLGPSRLPETARSLGRGMRELRDAVQGIGGNDDGDDEGGSAELEPPAPRHDDPGGLPVDPAVVMGDVPYDDDLPDAPLVPNGDRAAAEADATDAEVADPAADEEERAYQNDAESSTPSASS
jgi:sec-independent protein translocase protein TatA